MSDNEDEQLHDQSSDQSPDDPERHDQLPETDESNFADVAAAVGAPEEVAAPEPPIVRDTERLPSILESLLFAADRPLSVTELAGFIGERDHKHVEAALQTLADASNQRGIQLHPVAGGWQFRTHPENAPWVQRLLAQKPVRLTRSQLETMAIIGYRQPITRPEIDEIRGVDSGGTLKTLLDRSLVRILGKTEEPGRPLLYGTTKEFLGFFNLRDLRDLPTLREFQELSQEHQAQVAALEEAATPGTIDPAVDSATLERVELSADLADEDLGEIDALIDQVSARVHAVTEAMGSEAKEPGAAAQPNSATQPKSAAEG